ncbi:MAG: ankyrin repeat domain-containing protein [Candidatus Riflebacteria bacterium]|nr:ankyrin repeat domain-containing protein [Candidatus Riflebacteria bacterium]
MDIFQLIRSQDNDRFFSLLKTIDLNIRNEFGQNLLHEAIACANTLAGVELIKCGINVNSQDSQGLTPLHFAASYRNQVLAKLILEHGGDLLIVDNHGNNPLWTAVFNARGNYEIVEMLTKSGGDAFQKNKHSKSPLDFAKQIGDLTLVALLSKNNLKVGKIQ